MSNNNYNETIYKSNNNNLCNFYNNEVEINPFRNFGRKSTLLQAENINENPFRNSVSNINLQEINPFRYDYTLSLLKQNLDNLNIDLNLQTNI